uniref:Uncharacterized protein n=1 Tax=Romanomermis culicivorax TaxID=13658 RepID=A0A915JCU8_ROMCU
MRDSQGILHLDDHEAILCLSYYAPIEIEQTVQFLIFSFLTRTLAIGGQSKQRTTEWVNE